MSSANRNQTARSLLGFFIGSVLFSAASNSAHPVTPTMFINLGFADYMFGVALACNLLTNFLFSPFWGKLNTYVSSRYLLAIGCAGYALSQTLFCLSTTELQIIIARLICGLFVGSVFVGQLTYIVHESSESARGRNLATLATINAVASAFGYMVGGLLGNIGVRVAIWTQVAVLLLAGVIFFFSCVDDNEYSIKDADKKKLVREGNPFSSFLAARSFLTPLFFCLFLMAMLQNMGQTCFDQSFNYYTKDQFGFSSGYTGIIKGGIGLITLLANTTLCTWLMRKTDTRKSCIPILGMCTLSMAASTLAGEVAPFVGSIVVLFAFSAVSIPLLQDLVASHGADSDAGIVMGFYNSMKYLGGVFGALMSGFLYNWNPKFPFLMGTCIFGLATILACIYYLKEKSEERAAR